jgi:hypothetical protein
MSKTEARRIVYLTAMTLCKQGVSQQDFKLKVDLSPWELGDNFNKALDLVPEVFEHVLAFVWTWK